MPVEEPSTASKADIRRLPSDVRFVPTSDVTEIPPVLPSVSDGALASLVGGGARELAMERAPLFRLDVREPDRLGLRSSATQIGKSSLCRLPASPKYDRYGFR